MRNSIMTEKIARRGVPVVAEYTVDFLSQVLAKDVASRPVVTLGADRPLRDVLGWIASRARGSEHQGFPVVGTYGELVGVVTRRDLLDPVHDPARLVGELVRRAPIFIHEEATLREVADRMVMEKIGRVPVVSRAAPKRPIGMISRSDLLNAHARRLTGERRAEKTFTLGRADPMR
jgi:CBS domain-containing protein